MEAGGTILWKLKNGSPCTPSKKAIKETCNPLYISDVKG